MTATPTAAASDAAIGRAFRNLLSDPTHRWRNDNRCFIDAVEYKANQSAQPSGVAGEWYCPICCTTVPPVDVTYAETHVACGTTVTGSAPPIAQQGGGEVPFTDASVDTIQARMCEFGFTVPVRVISEGLQAALASKADGEKK